MNGIEVYVKYSNLDKRWEYYIVNDLSVYSQWVWFYLGNYLLNNIRLYPYTPCMPLLKGKSKLIANYSDTSLRADQVAKRIANKIDNHYFKNYQEKENV